MWRRRIKDMRVGVPREVKSDEYRGGMRPVGAAARVRAGRGGVIGEGGGAGVVGMNAAKVAAGLGASVALMDVNLDRLRYLDDVMPANVKTIFSDPHTIREHLLQADLVVGAVLIPGAKAPRLVTRQDLIT